MRQPVLEVKRRRSQTPAFTPAFTVIRLFVDMKQPVLQAAAEVEKVLMHTTDAVPAGGASSG